MNTNTTTADRTEQITETQETSTAQICFGAIMATASIAGIWGAVSLLISFYTG